MAKNCGNWIFYEKKNRFLFRSKILKLLSQIKRNLINDGDIFNFVILLGAVFVIKRLGAPKNLAAPPVPHGPYI